MAKLPDGSIIIHGDQRGADLISDTEASRRGFEIMALPADWDTFGDKAGPIRNEEMLQRLLAASKMGMPVRAFAFHHDPQLGVGTKDMVRRCIKNRIRVEAYIIGESEMVRVGTYGKCPECSVEYLRHPIITSVLDWKQEPFLELACDGRFLKL